MPVPPPPRPDPGPRPGSGPDPDPRPDPGPAATHPDLPAAQAVLDGAYAHLRRMAAQSRAALAAAERAGRSGEVDGDIAAAHLRQRVRHLDPDVDGLVFGHILGEDASGWHVGRRHVEDEAGDPVVVDWRAPVAVPFYRATPIDPQGLVRRRRFLTEGRSVVELFDDDLSDPDLAGEVRAAGIPDPLLAELERSRTGSMRDIVATIAAEQDEVIRAPLEVCLVVQGGPGTGKTAVGLHRAAFLLYEHRERLERDGVLVVGPNPVFLRYISAVLPSLGETAARQSTVERLVAGAVGGRVRAVDEPRRAGLLGDDRMARVLERAITGQRRPASADLVIDTPWGRVTLTAAEVQETLDEVAERDVPWAVGRGAARQQLVRRAVERHVARRGEASGPADELDAAVRGSDALRGALARLWPSASAPSLVRRLLTSPAALRRAADGILTPEEQRLVLRPAARSLADERWTPGEATLVDEAAARIDGVGRTYGHLVVDEAQDLTAMGLRALARRVPSRSMTVLGDIAQASEPGAVGDWERALLHMGAAGRSHPVTLSVGYRVPQAVMAVADRLLPRIAPALAPTTSVRVGGRAPRWIATDPAELVAAAVAAATDLGDRHGSVGLIVPPVPAGDEEVLHRSVARAVAALDPGAGADLDVVTPAEAKGLEFDGVVVVEPAAFADLAPDPRAAGRLLYVALTRAVQELVVLGAGPLPAELADLADPPDGASTSR